MAAKFGDDGLGGLLGGLSVSASDDSGGGDAGASLGGLLSGLSKNVVNAAGRALPKATQQGFSAGLGALNKVGRAGQDAANLASGVAAGAIDLHAHPQLVPAKAALPREHRAGFDTAVALAAGHLKRPVLPPGHHPLGVLGHAAYLITHGLHHKTRGLRRGRHGHGFVAPPTGSTALATAAGTAPDTTAVVNTVANAGADAQDGVATALAQIHHESAVLKVAEVAGGGIAAGGLAYVVLGAKTALVLTAKVAVSGGIGVAVAGIVWAVRHKKW